MKQSTSSRSILALIVTFLATVLTKKAKISIDAWDFANTNCVLLTRFGSEMRHSHLKLRHKVNWIKEEERQAWGNSSIELLIVTEAGHKKIQELTKTFEMDIHSKVIAHIGDKKVISILNDHEEDIDLILPRGDSLYFFYVCDYHNQISRNYKAKLDKYRSEQAKTNEDNPTISARLYSSISLAAGTKIEIRAILREASEYYHSIEERHLVKITSTFLVLYGIIAIHLIQRLLSLHKKNETDDHPLLLVGLSVLMMLFSVANKLVHFAVYSRTGHDLHFFELTSRVFYVFSDSVLFLFFILMSKGWGLGAINPLSEYLVESVGAIVLLLARFVWVIYGHYFERKSEDVYHMYDGISGKLELLNLVVLYFWYFSSVTTQPLFSQPKYKGLKIQLHLLTALAYILRAGGILLIDLLSREYQHGYSWICTLGTHWMTCALLSAMFTHSRGTYMRVSISNGIELAGDTRLQ